MRKKAYLISRLGEVQEQVKVIAHQTIVVKPEAEAVSIALDQTEEGLAILRTPTGRQESDGA